MFLKVLKAINNYFKSKQNLSKTPVKGFLFDQGCNIISVKIVLCRIATRIIETIIKANMTLS